MENIDHGALAIMVMIFDVFSHHLMLKGGIPSMLRMVLMGLDRKVQMNIVEFLCCALVSIF